MKQRYLISNLIYPCVCINSLDLHAGRLGFVLESELAKGRCVLTDPHSRVVGGLANCRKTQTCGNSKIEPLIYNLPRLPHTPKHTQSAHTHIATPPNLPDHHLLGAIIDWDRGYIEETLGRGLTVRSSPALVLKGLSTQEQKDSERKRKRGRRHK